KISPLGATRIWRGLVRPLANSLTSKPGGTLSCAFGGLAITRTPLLAEPVAKGRASASALMCQRLPGASSRQEVATVRPPWLLVTRAEFCAEAAAARNSRAAQVPTRTGRMGRALRYGRSCRCSLARKLVWVLAKSYIKSGFDSLVPRSQGRAM